MDKITKTFLNSLKCPVCQSQIDAYDLYQKNAKSTRFNFCCVADHYHYRMAIPPLVDSPEITYDMVDVYEGKHQFRIYQHYFNIETIIDIWEVDEEHNLLNEENKFFRCDKIIFNWQNTNRDKIVNRIKTILTFQ